MGGVGTFTDGIRRFFNRRTTSINSNVVVDHNDDDVGSNANSVHIAHNNIDPSSLNPLKVPAQSNFAPSSMDRPKKVQNFGIRFVIC